MRLPSAPRVSVRPMEGSDRDELLALARESRSLHRPWAFPPDREEAWDELLARTRRDDFASLVATRRSDEAIVGVFNLSQIVRGGLQSASLGYYAHEHHAGRGYMGEALRLVVVHAFATLRLHRLEANVQPANAASIGLARSVGFRLEGLSPRYLMVGGEWRDHERYALLADEAAALGPG